MAQEIVMNQYLTFDVAEHAFAMPLLRVREILEHRPLTRVPGSSDFVAGVFNHGGVVLPVVDLAAKFGKGTTETTRRTCIVVVGAEHGSDELPIGLLVGSVREVLDVGSDAVEPPPDFGARIRLDYLDGLVRRDHGFVTILNADKFLTAAELLEISRQRESLKHQQEKP